MSRSLNADGTKREPPLGGALPWQGAGNRKSLTRPELTVPRLRALRDSLSWCFRNRGEIGHAACADLMKAVDECLDRRVEG